MVKLGFLVLLVGVNLRWGISVEEIFDGFFGKDGGRGRRVKESECAIGEGVVKCLFWITGEIDMGNGSDILHGSGKLENWQDCKKKMVSFG